MNTATWLFCTLPLLIFGPSVYAAPPETTSSQWNIIKHTFGVRYIVHGQKAYGHEFGFIKMHGHCDRDLIWVNLSTYVEAITTFKDSIAQLNISTDDTTTSIQAPLYSVSTINPLLHIVTFTNTILDEQLHHQIAQATEINLSITEPAPLATLFDLGNEIFQVSKFSETRKEAFNICKSKTLNQLGYN